MTSAAHRARELAAGNRERQATMQTIDANRGNAILGDIRDDLLASASTLTETAAEALHSDQAYAEHLMAEALWRSTLADYVMEGR